MNIMEKPHKRLDAWKESVTLVTLVYELTRQFPRNEVFGLTSQLRRAVISIPGNVAEGAARQTRREFVQFLYIARGSLSEVDTYIEIARRLGYIEKGSIAMVEEKMVDVDKIITGLIKSLKSKN
ncbi:MAG TPA: four helix bundle protein [Thermodesulfobacteriota bacterium]|nr:four helix bundle protein [Thermodesulfobacteriota bacterium]